jgi:uncharacterized protein
MKKFLLFVTGLFPMVCTAQKNPKIVNSLEILQSGIAKYDKGAYKEAINLYTQIPNADTNYQLTCFELAMAYHADDQLDKAIEVAKEGIAAGGKLNMESLFLLGSIYDTKKDYTSAQNLFDSVIANYPNNAKGYYSKGVSYALDGKMEKALLITEKALTINPFNENAHFTYGLINYMNGNIIPSYVALTTYLMTAPNDNRKRRAIGLLGDMAIAKDTFLKLKEKRQVIPGEDDFSEAEAIVLSKMALDKNYKAKSSLNDAIIKQLQAILDLTTKNTDGKSFFSKFYLPMYKKMMEQDKFETISYRIVSGLDIEEVNKYVKKNEKEIEALKTQLSDFYNVIGFYRSPDWADKKIDESLVGYYFSKGDVYGKGIFNEKRGIRQGEWETYFSNGKVKTKELYSLSGKANGPYKSYYNETGTLEDDMELLNGNPNGIAKKYYENGNLMLNINMQNGKRNGVFTKYYNNGSIQEESNYTNGLANGASKSYYYNGGLEFESNYRADKAVGKFTEYYKNGNKYYETTMVDGQRNGPFTYYNQDKTLFSKGTFKNNKKEGTEIVYHNNGKVKTEYNYEGGELDGVFKIYDKKGKLTMQETYKNGEKNDKTIYYDSQGNIWSEIVFNKGRFKEVNYFNPSTKQVIVQQDITSKSENELQIFDRLGIKLSDVVCDREGLYNGEKTTYFENGKVKSEGSYVKGKAQGKHISYHMNGKVASESNYVDDILEGPYTSYYSNGKLSVEGNYLKGRKQSIWYSYNQSGYLTDEEYFEGGENTGVQKSFNNKGKLVKVRTAKDGVDVKDTYYDADGKVIRVVNLFNEKLVSYYNEFGFNYLKCKSENNYSAGEQVLYNPDNSIKEKRTVTNGEFEGDCKMYNDFGLLALEGAYINGSKYGLWKSYDDQGKLTREEIFYNGDTEDTLKNYYYNGKVDFVIEYSNDIKDGKQIRYAPNGDLMYQLHFDEGTLVSYTYSGKDGKLLPEIPVKNGAANIVAFYANGQSVGTITYENSKLNGVYKLLHPNGKVLHEETLSYNNTEGDYKTYYEDGSPRVQAKYAMDELNGPYKKYDTNGQLLENGFYAMGKEDGVYRYYKNGKIDAIITYENGTTKKVERP